jgi:hypothetical protein
MTARLSFVFITALLAYGRKLNTSGTENLLWNGDKAYYQGGGWWRFHSYSTRSKTQLKMALLSRCKKCGKDIGILHIYCINCSPDF